MRGAARLALATILPLVASCSILPRELNLSPLWFHRLDEQGNLLEMDALWPVIHYEQTEAGGDDFRIRPLYRRITEPDPAAVEHQFLWPLGRVRSDAEEASSRIFPLWSYRRHVNQHGEQDVDWYALFPLLWGGKTDSGDENYFAFFPFYADIPDFLTYDRFQTVLFPLYVRLDKEGHRHYLTPWPFVGFSTCAEGPHDWFRVWPLYGHDLDAGKHARHFAAWPFFSWGTENLDTDDPVHTFWAWPIYGERWSRRLQGRAILWPLFEQIDQTDGFHKLNVLWPLFHYYKSETSVDQHLTQWWFWPFVGRALSDDQDSWSFLWPLIWWRNFHDPQSETQQQWFLPLLWHIRTTIANGATEDHLQFWPFAHRTEHRDQSGALVRGNWSVFSPLPWRDGNATGFSEIYGFLWELATGRQRNADDHSVDLVARAYSRRERKNSTTSSVPFLFNCESDSEGDTVRLFQFLPLHFNRGDSAK